MSDVRGRPFEAGNKFGRGRPKGSRNKVRPEHLINDHGELVIRKCLQMVTQGNPTALRLLMERLTAKAKGAKIKLRLPRMETAQDVGNAMDLVVNAVVRGHLSPSDGNDLTGMLEAKLRFIQTVNLDARVRKLESISNPPSDGRACYPPWVTAEHLTGHDQPGEEEANEPEEQDRAA